MVNQSKRINIEKRGEKRELLKPKNDIVFQSLFNQKNEEIKKATEKVEKMSEDEKLRRLAYLREKAILDEKDIYRAGVDKGVEDGKIEGIKEATLKIAKKMKEEGYSIDRIIEITELTEEEINNI